MARPTIPVGSRGKITYDSRPGRVVAQCYVRDLDGSRHRIKASGTSEQEARDALVARLTLRSAGLGRGVVSPTMSVADLGLVWLVSLRGKAEGTLEAYRRTLRLHIVPALGELSLEEATPARLGSFLDNFAAESAAAARLARVVLRGMFALAVSAGALAADPVPEDAGVAPVGLGSPTRLSRLQFLQLREAARRWMETPTMGLPRSRDLVDQIDLLLGSGCRRVGEMLAASWSDFDLEAGTWRVSAVVDRSDDRGLHVRRYGREAYEIRLPGFVLAMLRRRGPGSGLVFPARTGGPIDPPNFRRSLVGAAPQFVWVKPGALVNRDVEV